MSQAPVFNLTGNNVEGVSDKDLAEAEKRSGKFFDEAGTYELTITAADFHITKGTESYRCAKDPTWFNVKVTLTALDGKSKDYWVQVPTSKITYGNADKSYFVYRKFREFMAGIGEVLVSEQPGFNVFAKAAEYFTDPVKLVGKKVTVEMKYGGDHIVQDGPDFYIMSKGKRFEQDGEPVRSPDRSSARKTAEGYGITVEFIEITKFIARKPSKKATTDW